MSPEGRWQLEVGGVELHPPVVTAYIMLGKVRGRHHSPSVLSDGSNTADYLKIEAKVE
jgi:hypothetical protein